MKCMFAIRSLTGGGAERVVSVFANNLVKKGYDVHIVVYSKTDKDYYLDPNVNVIEMPKRRDGIITKFLRINDMKKIISEIKPDLVIPFVGTIQYVTWFAAKANNIKYILTVRNNPWLMPKSKIYKKLRDYISKKCSAIMVQNEEQTEYFSKKIKDKIFIVENPISEQFLNHKKEKYSENIMKIVTVGRLDKQKNQILLIKAIQNIALENKNITLDIYGEGPERQNLITYIEDNNLSNICNLKGRICNIEESLKEYDLFIMTSDFEGMPNALMEAMAIGLPCISSDCSTGPKTLIKDNVDGILFHVGDLRELEEKIRFAINNTKEINEMGKNAREKIINSFSKSKIIEKFDNMISYIENNKNKSGNKIEE